MTAEINTEDRLATEFKELEASFIPTEREKKLKMAELLSGMHDELARPGRNGGWVGWFKKQNFKISESSTQRYILVWRTFSRISKELPVHKLFNWAAMCEAAYIYPDSATAIIALVEEAAKGSEVWGSPKVRQFQSTRNFEAQNEAFLVERDTPKAKKKRQKKEAAKAPDPKQIIADAEAYKAAHKKIPTGPSIPGSYVDDQSEQRMFVEPLTHGVLKITSSGAIMASYTDVNRHDFQQHVIEAGKALLAYADGMAKHETKLKIA